MTSDKSKFPREEKEFNKWLVREYLKYFSVDEVLRINNYDIPISYAQFQRVLDKWGVIKAAGPNNKLSEAIEFFTYLVERNLSFEGLYKKMPPSFQTSASTLYRILGYIKEGITRRVGTALVITPYNLTEKILLATDISVPRIELGKPYGSLSLPMGYSRKRDSRKDSILRVLQQEVFMEKVIDQQIPQNLIPSDIHPFMYLDVADVRIALYHIQLPKQLSGVKNFSSYKLRDHRFYEIDEILNNPDIKNKLRAGVTIAVNGYKKYLSLLKRNLSVNPLQLRAEINTNLSGDVHLSVER